MGFDLESFAASCKRAMDGAEDRHAGLRSTMASLLASHSTAEVVATLEAAIPAGADIGEMIVHQSDELTLLYGRIPPRFQSGIHDHTVFACIAQLVGQEKNTFFEPDGDGLRVAGERTISPGEILDLPAEAIHCIENPGHETGSALHAYGGDFRAVQPDRRLWSSAEHVATSFTFEGLLRESIVAMLRDGNEAGIDAIRAAIPATRKMVDELR